MLSINSGNKLMSGKRKPFWKPCSQTSQECADARKPFWNTNKKNEKKSSQTSEKLLLQSYLRQKRHFPHPFLLIWILSWFLPNLAGNYYPINWLSKTVIRSFLLCKGEYLAHLILRYGRTPVKKKKCQRERKMICPVSKISF